MSQYEDMLERRVASIMQLFFGPQGWFDLSSTEYDIARSAVCDELRAFGQELRSDLSVAIARRAEAELHAARAKERERCARVCEKFAEMLQDAIDNTDVSGEAEKVLFHRVDAAENCASIIRKLGDAP